MTAGAAAAPPQASIVIPAHDEEALLPRCLAALARQTGLADLAVEVVVLADRCSDRTVAVATAAGGALPMPLRVVERHAAPGDDTGGAAGAAGAGGAGGARRAAVAAAHPGTRLILTTDADCVPDDDWVASHVAAIARGADAVAGRVEGDWEELRHQPAASLVVGALEWDYLALLPLVEHRLDPVPHDPLPRHAQVCGANLSFTREVLAAVGGIPAIPTGEDRAVIAAITAIDGRVRHDPGPRVVASARTAGRAGGGMADALAARVGPSYRSDEQYEAAAPLIARLTLRGRLRAAHGDGPVAWGRALAAAGLPSMSHGAGFGAAWARIAATTPALRHEPLSPSELARALADLARWLDVGPPPSLARHDAWTRGETA